MSKLLPYILATVIGFAAGIYSGVLIKRTPRIPAPPASILEEVKDAAPGAPAPAAPASDEQRELAFRQIRAEMEDFRKKCDAMKSSLRAQMEPLLTPAQRERMSRWGERSAPPAPSAAHAPLTPGSRNFWEGFESAMVIMMVPFTLERMEESLQLTPDQKNAVRKLLLERRAKFLELIDTTPPPSFKLLNLAPPEAKAKD